MPNCDEMSANKFIFLSLIMGFCWQFHLESNQNENYKLKITQMKRIAQMSAGASALSNGVTQLFGYILYDCIHLIQICNAFSGF